MSTNSEKAFEQMNFIEKLKATGPAWMAAGLNIGGATVTNSVLLAAATGFTFGWVFLLATLAIFFATYACVQLTILTNKDPISLISAEMGSFYGYLLAIAILIVNTVFFGVNVSLAGNVVSTLVPAVSNRIGSLLILVGSAAFILLPGKSANVFIQKSLKYMVYVLSVSYLLSLFVVKVDWSGFVSGL
ncbi:MAG: divalent metal cation transporter, partial [Synergistaceae bacterium]|nr:divalent metal cation transporter [Synergistaceae bacterium]